MTTRAKAQYKQYMRSAAWRRLSKIAKFCANHRCENCRQQMDPEFLHTVHRHYKTVGKERLCDLKVLCTRCHADSLRYPGQEEPVVQPAANPVDIDNLRAHAEREVLPKQATQELPPRLQLALRLCQLLQFRNDCQPFYLSYETMGKVLGSKNPVAAGGYSLKRLISLGYLERVEQGSKFTGKASTYRLR